MLEPVDRNVDNEQMRTALRTLVALVGGLAVDFTPDAPAGALGDAGGDPPASGTTLVFIVEETGAIQCSRVWG